MTGAACLKQLISLYHAATQTALDPLIIQMLSKDWTFIAHSTIFSPLFKD